MAHAPANSSSDCRPHATAHARSDAAAIAISHSNPDAGPHNSVTDKRPDSATLSNSHLRPHAGPLASSHPRTHYPGSHHTISHVGDLHQRSDGCV